MRTIKDLLIDPELSVSDIKSITEVMQDIAVNYREHGVNHKTYHGPGFPKHLVAKLEKYGFVVKHDFSKEVFGNRESPVIYVEIDLNSIS